MRKPLLLLFVNIGVLLVFVGVLALLPETTPGWPVLFLFVSVLVFVNVIFWRAVRSKGVATYRPRSSRQVISEAIIGILFSLLAILSFVLGRYGHFNVR